jgi:hypothetical protein
MIGEQVKGFEELTVRFLATVGHRCRRSGSSHSPMPRNTLVWTRIQNTQLAMSLEAKQK